MPPAANRLSAESSQRIRDALTETLLRECSDAIEPRLHGAWSLLIEDGCTWKAQARLDNGLLCALRGHFGSNIIREILLAAAGVKISRTCLSDARLELLRGIAEEHGFEIAAGSERYIHRRDSGKGGSSNSIERLALPGEEAGLRNVYIGTDASLAKTGEMLEESGDDENFGRLLGIPSCCREAYIRASPLASASQNDCVLPALDNTNGQMPYDSWVNYPAAYFGPGLISFFPCSFVCSNAAAVARSSFEMLSVCDAAWAQSFLKLQKTNVLYTEYDGLHLFRRPLVDGCIRYGPLDYISTEPGRVTELISQGSLIEVHGKHSVLIRRGSEYIGSLDGPDVGMCAFY